MFIDPLAELDRLARDMSNRQTLMPVDAYRYDDKFYLHFDLPGVDPESIDITMERNTLTVTAERNWRPVDDAQVLLRERRQGTITRRFRLGDGLDPTASKPGTTTVCSPSPSPCPKRRSPGRSPWAHRTTCSPTDPVPPTPPSPRRRAGGSTRSGRYCPADERPPRVRIRNPGRARRPATRPRDRGPRPPDLRHDLLRLRGRPERRRPVRPADLRQHLHPHRQPHDGGIRGAHGVSRRVDSARSPPPRVRRHS
jgi:hypothetical protein